MTGHAKLDGVGGLHRGVEAPEADGSGGKSKQASRHEPFPLPVPYSCQHRTDPIRVLGIDGKMGC